MDSNIEKLIRSDKLIINCKKESKSLRDNTHKSLMDCQNIIAQKYGYFDWHTMHTKIKKKYIQSFNLLEKLIVKNFKSDYSIMLSINNNDVKIRIIYPEGFTSEIIEETNLETIINFYKKHTTNIDFILHKNNNNFCNVSIFSFDFFNNDKKLGYLIHQYIPTYQSGFDIILKPKLVKTEIRTLQQLGFSQEQEKILLNNPQKGVIFFAGSTHSGKEKSVESLIYELKKSGHKIFKDNEILHPEKCDIKNSIIKTELKNQHTKNIIKNFSSNNYIISEVHSSSGFGILARLKDFKISHLDMNLMVYSQFIPLLCPYCKRNSNLNKKEMDILQKIKKEYDILQNNIFFKGIGCKHCHFGLKGRTVCAEIIQLDEHILTYLNQNVMFEDIGNLYYYWKSLSDKNVMSKNTKGKTSYDNALQKMFNGQIGPEEIIARYRDFS